MLHEASSHTMVCLCLLSGVGTGFCMVMAHCYCQPDSLGTRSPGILLQGCTKPWPYWHLLGY
jgi:hypothetical protein